jgi:lactose/L-arabinose transport system ATP-binding protein
MSGVTLDGAVKKYGEVQVIHGVDLQIEHGEFCVFVGPSGCGKSTLLRMIAGLEETTGGKISIGKRDVTKSDPAERGVAMVFQTYALYPHMTVEENMGFGLKMNGHAKAEIKEKVGEAARILKLEPYLAAQTKGLVRRPAPARCYWTRHRSRHRKSSCSMSRCRTLMRSCALHMRVEIARLHKDIGATMIYVTHDQVEAMTLGRQDRGSARRASLNRSAPR